VESSASPLRLNMLGPLTIERDGAACAMPASRKVCGLIAYLALSPRPTPRARLCELLWDEAANDPRGELRWCLSKLRGALDDADGRALVASGDTIALRPEAWIVDAWQIAGAVERGLGALDATALQQLSDLYRGELLEGLALERSPEYHLWLTGQRSRYAAYRADLLQRLAAILPADSAQGFAALETWAEIAPFDAAAQALLLKRLAERGRLDAARQRLEAAERLYRAEGLDAAPLRTALRDRRPASPAAPAPSAPPDGDAGGAPAARASLAVMPFQTSQDDAVETARGLTHDVISRLAKLRSFFVIAEGSVFALAERRVAPQEAGRRLKVEYVALSTLTRRAGRLVIAIELIETSSGRILWSEDFERAEPDTLAAVDEIADRIVAAIANEVEVAERNRARLRAPESLDAWQAYHRGLWHMYRFTRAENDLARRLFERAAALDPTFARAHAGLSFTHWQSAFQHWEDRRQAMKRALDNAGLALLADEHDPAAHWAMGRAQWLCGRHEAAADELKQAVRLSPNFALGHYALAFVQSQSGDPQAAIEAGDHSRLLSPYDPLLFAMLGSRAMALVRLGRYEEGAAWSLKAAAQPNAHVLIFMIAALCHGLAGRIEQARSYAVAARAREPGFALSDYLTAFQFSPDAAALFRQAAARIGLT
jgi:TolB-like protein/DNA-binding SARP family transcriptional activator/Flp pilus assembly protein TadD